MKKPEIRIFSSKNLSDKWYVYIYLDGKIIKKIYKGLNKGVTFEERMISAEALKLSLEKELNSGWNPKLKKQKPTEIKLFDALAFGLEKKKRDLSDGSFTEYTNSVNIFKKYANEIGLSSLELKDCEKYHIKSVLELARSKRKWSARNNNKTLRNLGSIFSELVEWDMIQQSPTKDLKPIKEINVGNYELLNDEEQKEIFEELRKISFNYYVFCSIVYYMGIRPGELLKVKCEDVLLDKGLIKITSESSKTNKTRIVPILGAIADNIGKFDLSNPNFFLFGKNTINRVPKLSEAIFCPNKYPIKRNYPTYLWRNIVIKELEIDKKLYSLKHKGANDKLKSGLDLKTVSSIFGHSTEKMTEIYANYINEIRLEDAKKINLDEY
ncbi:tyrosine-type recombinase/integrase [Chryseobacterium sp. MYb328]|uniref:tyrosine-type recombinase/integrase n=1 Tax=Chryseobacterium sp. MYb328 TaxID=2745231 RepID=UPI0030B7D516